MRIAFLSLVGLSLVGGAERALAEPVHLVCAGKNYFHTDPRQAQAIKNSVSLTIEWDYSQSSSSLQVGKAHSAPWGKPYSGEALPKQRDNYWRHVCEVRLRIGTFDRLTGQLYLDFGILAVWPGISRCGFLWT